MTPVRIAIAAAPMEAQVVSVLATPGSGVDVVRRCLDVTDLVGLGSAGVIEAVIVGAALPGMSADAVTRLRGCGVRVVGLAAEDVEAARLQALGINVHLLRGAPTSLDEEGMRGTIADLTRDEPSAMNSGRPSATSVSQEAAPPGRLIAVWGPIGSPGRTSLSLGLADELSRAGCETLLVDADTYGACIAARLGMLDDVSGLIVACRQADVGTLDPTGLLGSARMVSDRLRVMSGIPRPDRWAELRGSAFERMWHQCRSLPLMTVVDAGFCLEADEELLSDARVQRRNAATLTAIESADVVIAVGGADAVGIERLLVGLEALRRVRDDVAVVPVVNRVRSASVGRDAGGQLREALGRHASIVEAHLVPDDPAAFDRSLRESRFVADVSPRSPARKAMARIADSVRAEASRRMTAA